MAGSIDDHSISQIYELLLKRDEPSPVTSKQKPPYQRSASDVLFDLPPQPPKSPPPTPLISSYSSVLDGNTEISLTDVSDLINTVLKERETLQNKVTELEGMLEVARRERLLAYEERDKLLHSHHLCKVSSERTAATLHMIECEKTKFAKRCADLENDNITLQQANDAAQTMREAALQERSKLIEERQILQSEIKRLQDERDELFEKTLILQHKLQETVSEQQKLHSQLEHHISLVTQLERLSRSLKLQNEILCGKSCVVLDISLQRQKITESWGFSIDGGCSSEYLPGDPSIFITGITPESAAAKALRYGDRLESVDGISVKGLSKSSIGELIHQFSNELTLSLSILRVCPPDPVKMRVYLPHNSRNNISTLGFSYRTQYIISDTEKDSPLQKGDQIIKIQDTNVDGLRTSQLRKLLQSCRSDVVMEIKRPPTVLSDHDSKEHSITSKQSSITDSEQSVGYSNISSTGPLCSPPVSDQMSSHHSQGSTTYRTKKMTVLSATNNVTTNDQ